MVGYNYLPRVAQYNRCKWYVINTYPQWLSRAGVNGRVMTTYPGWLSITGVNDRL